MMVLHVLGAHNVLVIVSPSLMRSRKRLQVHIIVIFLFNDGLVVLFQLGTERTEPDHSYFVFPFSVHLPCGTVCV